jgi:hypothetical protein
MARNSPAFAMQLVGAFAWLLVDAMARPGAWSRVPPRLLLKYPLSPRVTSTSDAQSACFVGSVVKIRRLKNRASSSTDTDDGKV